MIAILKMIVLLRKPKKVFYNKSWFLKLTFDKIVFDVM